MHIWWKVDNWSCAEDDVAIGATEDEISPACLEEEAIPFPSANVLLCVLVASKKARQPRPYRRRERL